jgi:hypothetical protein
MMTASEGRPGGRGRRSLVLVFLLFVEFLRDVLEGVECVFACVLDNNRLLRAADVPEDQSDLHEGVVTRPVSGLQLYVVWAVADEDREVIDLCRDGREAV